MITAPKGFVAAGGHAGVKADGVFDLALVVAEQTAVAAAVFTTNRAAAAPVTLSRAHAADGHLRAVVLNSGCANAGTGPGGAEDAAAMAAVTAEALGCPVDEVAVCSTGPIGPRLPMAAVDAGIRRLAGELAADPEAADRAARAILTTDTVTKTASHADAGWTIGGIAKGAAMCRPDMATMLAVITTDAVLSPETARWALTAAVEPTFNSLNIDGCQSTNDTVILLASGASGVEPDPSGFVAGLTEVCERLARQMAADGEETTKVIDVVVTGAVSDADARALGKAITDSDLVRASFYGGDPNWGRILQAIGQTDIPADLDAVSITFAGVAVAVDSAAVAHDRAALIERLSGDFEVTVTVGTGPGTARIIAADLTPGYVAFNGEPS